MIKAVGAFLLLVACTGMGFRIAGEYRDRPKHLRSLLQAMRLLQADVEYGVVPLPHALAKVATRTTSPMNDMFHRIAEQLQQTGVSVEEAFHIGIAQCKDHCALKPADFDVLSELSKVLGRTDRAHLTQQFGATQMQLEGLLAEAVDAQRRNERLWQYLGILSGLLFVILLY